MPRFFEGKFSGLPNVQINSRRQPINGYYLVDLIFYNSKNLNCIGRCLLRSLHTFSWFLKSNWSSDTVLSFLAFSLEVELILVWESNWNCTPSWNTFWHQKKTEKNWSIYLFNSREAIAAIIGNIVVFLIRRLHRLFLRPDFLELTFSTTLVISTALQLKFVSVTSFLLFGQLRDLPHS